MKKKKAIITGAGTILLVFVGITAFYLHDKNKNNSHEIIDYNDLYYRFIQDELITEHGMSSLEQMDIDNSAPPDYSNYCGIISADIHNINNDVNLLTIRLETIEDSPHLILDLYEYNSTIHLIDSYNIEMPDYTIGFEVSWSDDCIYISNWYHYNYVSSTFGSYDTILSINDGQFTPVFNLLNSWHAGGYNLIRDTISGNTYYEADGGSFNGLSDGIELIDEDLSDIGFTNFEVSCDSNPESFHFNVIATQQVCRYDVYADSQIDYTNLRDHY